MVDGLGKMYSLRDLRKVNGVSAPELAEGTSVTAGAVRMTEWRGIGSHKVDTVRRYVEALGGELKITAVFDDGCSYEIEVDKQG